MIFRNLFKSKTNDQPVVEEVKPLTADDIKREHPDVYEKIFNEGVSHTYQKGVLPNDLKRYPNGEELAQKVVNGEMTIEQAAVAALESQDKETTTEPSNEQFSNVVGFDLKKN